MTNHYSLRIISLSLLLSTSLSMWYTFFCRIQPFLAFCLWPHWFLTCLSLWFGRICVNDSDQTKTLYKWWGGSRVQLILPMPWMWTSNQVGVLHYYWINMAYFIGGNFILIDNRHVISLIYHDTIFSLTSIDY